MIIDPEFKSFIPPLSPDEYARLESEIVAAGGATTPLDVWDTGDSRNHTLIDGHNRYEICERLGLDYTLRIHAFPDRSAVKAWIFEHQIARRNLSPSQMLMLAALRGVPIPVNATPREREMVMALAAPDKAEPAAKVIAGRLSLAQAYGLYCAPRKPRAPRGPSAKPAIPEGHELAGVSTLTGPDGEVKGEWAKTRIHGADEPPQPIPDGHLVKRTATLQRGDGTTVAQWVTTAADEKRREDAMREAWAAHAKNYAGLAGTAPAPEVTSADLVTLYPLGDPHIGMLAWGPESGDSFDVSIACRELLGCVTELVGSAPASDRAIVTNLGDFLHAQDDTALTPGHGNRLDVDGRFSKVLEAGHAVLRGIVDAALRKHRHVTVRNLPGNHDPRVAAELAMWLRAVYESEPRVTVADAYSAHQYDRFGSCLFGWHHGDRTPGSELPAIMAVDRAADWGETTTRVWHCGHVHHLSRKESPGCVVETHRTMAAGDAWHAGRYRAGRSLQAITYHRDHGETSRVTVGLSRVRAALKAAGS